MTHRRRLLTALGFVVVFTAFFVFDLEYHYLDDLSRQHAGTFGRRLLEEATGVYSFLVLLPFIVWLTRRFPICRTNWYRTVPIAIAGAIVTSFAHTTLMALSRHFIAPLAGLGPYDYGIMTYRYPMEASNDVVTYALVVGCVYAWDRIAAARRAELASAELETKLATARLENLQLQLNPHFLFNTLNAISAVMYEDVAKADAMIAKLSDFLRLVLASSGVQTVSLADELDAEHRYVDIMRARLEQKLRLQIDVAEACRDAAVPFLILQPLLENSIRHGVSPARGELDIAIRATRHDGSIVLSVLDDGTGLGGGGSPSGRGLSIVRSRLEQMYGGRATLELRDRETGGTQAIVALPYRAFVAGAPA